MTAPSLPKTPTGILGFDEITQGGLPVGRSTLVLGGAGSGKTVFSLQTLVNGARFFNEPGVFVAFEETAQRILANAAAFGWNLETLEEKKLFFLNVQPRPDTVQLGSFDLLGILAALGEKAKSMGAKRIVFDSVDVALSLLDPVSERQELYRLHDWLIENGLTALITAKDAEHHRERSSILQHMVDCAVILHHDVIRGISQRTLRVVKYRGASFSENESPLVITGGGIEVAGPYQGNAKSLAVSNDRVSSGIERLDSMLGGGYFRAASILVTGSPGTAKTTLGGAFAAAACNRGEPTLFVTFDSDPHEIIRNLSSVAIDLRSHHESGLLKMVGALGGEGSAEVHYLAIRSLARRHQARCVVIDPLSALAKQADERAAFSVVERLTRWTKAEGMTLFCTSLLGSSPPEAESTPLQISTIADTWIHLSYRVMAGERNRALTIIKSRGTEHSNQVRELILSGEGITLTDVFTAGGEVLMGTLRWEKEQEVKAAQQRSQDAVGRKLQELDLEEGELALRMRDLERELALKRRQRETVAKEASELEQRVSRAATDVRHLRSADSPGQPES